MGQPCAEADSSTADASVNCSPHCNLLYIQYLTEANTDSSKIIRTDLSDKFRHLSHMLLHNIMSELGCIWTCSICFVCYRRHVTLHHSLCLVFSCDIWYSWCSEYEGHSDAMLYGALLSTFWVNQLSVS